LNEKLIVSTTVLKIDDIALTKIVPINPGHVIKEYYPCPT